MKSTFSTSNYKIASLITTKIKREKNSMPQMRYDQRTVIVRDQIPMQRHKSSINEPINVDLISFVIFSSSRFKSYISLRSEANCTNANDIIIG